MGGRFSGLGKALYDPKRRQFLGRDGAAWGKLGVFYFFFYVGLAGFFCAMLAIFMALTPRDHPRYTLDASRMRTRSNPLAPGLGFRPQPEVDKSLILLKKNSREINPYALSLDQYLRVYYWKQDTPVERRENDEPNYGGESVERAPPARKFNIRDPRDCRNESQYGFALGRPCVLVKMNKIVDWKPTPGAPPHERAAYQTACPRHRQDAVAVHCQGEYHADAENIGPITYISENGVDPSCGYLETKWFPYTGKNNRKDYYQAPYIWVQFINPKPNVLINVLCRVYGQNIDFDKKAGRALTRFQIYVEDLPKRDRQSEAL